MDGGGYHVPNGVGTPHLTAGDSTRGPQVSHEWHLPQDLLKHASYVREGLPVSDIHQPFRPNHLIDRSPRLLVNIRV